MFGNLVTVAVVTSLAVAAGPAAAGDRHRWRDDRRADSDYARVVDVRPRYEQVAVRVPVESCWRETEYEGGRRRGSNAGASVLGGLVGAVVGNQFGSGSGRKVGAVAGAVIGSAVGSEIAANRAGGFREARAYEVERCGVVEETRYEERIASYRVTYEYNGRRQVTELPYDPGRRLRVAVDVRPLG
jgi:uncharacterized protein YcfJ